MHKLTPFDAKLLLDVLIQQIHGAADPEEFPKGIARTSQRLWLEEAYRIRNELQTFLQKTAS